MGTSMPSPLSTSSLSNAPVLLVTKKRKNTESEQVVEDPFRPQTINAFHRIALTLDHASAALVSTPPHIRPPPISNKEARKVLTQMSTMIQALCAGNVNDAVEKFEQLIQSENVATKDLLAFHTLQQATDCVYNRILNKLDSNSKSPTISPTAPPTKRVKPTLQLQRTEEEEETHEETSTALFPPAKEEEEEEEEVEEGPHASQHEEEAAQALTVLRGSSDSNEKATSTGNEERKDKAPSPSLPSISVPPLGPVMNPSYSLITPTPLSSTNVTLPSLSPHPSPTATSTSSMSILAPRQHPTFNPQTNGYSMTSPSDTNRTPGSLPSLFSRGLLTPIITSTSTPNGSPWMTSPLPSLTSTTTPNGHRISYPHVDWKNLPVPPPHPPTVYTSGSEVFTPSYPHSSPVKQPNILTKPLPSMTPTSSTSSTNTNAPSPITQSLAALERTQVVRKANPRRWTKEEDDALRTAVENHKEKNWKAIASQVPGRNHTQCLQRWTKVLAPGLVKGHWSAHEDDLLRILVKGGTKNWGEVASKIPGRTSKQCRERWHNHLDPQIVRTAYSPEEDRMILEAQARLGNRWSVIAAMLPGRTEDAVKIRWKSHCRVWKARKYLRKPMANGESETENDPTMDTTMIPSREEEEGQERLEEPEDTDSEADPSQVKVE